MKCKALWAVEPTGNPAVSYLPLQKYKSDTYQCNNRIQEQTITVTEKAKHARIRSLNKTRTEKSTIVSCTISGSCYYYIKLYPSTCESHTLSLGFNVPTTVFAASFAIFMLCPRDMVPERSSTTTISFGIGVAVSTYHGLEKRTLHMKG